MRITSATIYALRIPFVEAFSHSTKSRKFSDSFIVRVVADDGTVGYGEGVARPYVTGETVEACLDYIASHLWPTLASHEYAEIVPGPDAITTLAPVAESLPEHETSGVLAWHASRCAVELALIDCLLKRQNLSLAQIIPPRRNTIIYSGVITAGSTEKAMQHARHFKLFGIKQLKIKVTGERDARRVAGVREMVGPEASLRLDANGAYTVEQALKMLAELSPYGIDAVEQPIPRGLPDELAQLRAQSAVPVMADESLVTLMDARELIKASACDFFNLRLSKCGGIVRTLEMARLANNAGVHLQLGSQVGETAILSAAGRHVAAHLDDVRFVEGSYGTLLLTEDVGKESISFGHGGRAPLLRTVGLGTSVRDDILEKYAHARISL